MNNYKKLNQALVDINAVCNEWRALRYAHSGNGRWMFNYKLHDLFFECCERGIQDTFGSIAEGIYDQWKEDVREAAGYSPEKWDYQKYFEHDSHHGSYFTFANTGEEGGTLDFWAEAVGLEWDVASGDAWAFTPFEKAIYDTYGKTRFSTDRAKPEDYDQEEIDEIVEVLKIHTLPAIRETLEERKAVIRLYDSYKSRQKEWAENLQ